MPFVTILDQKVYYQHSVPENPNGITFFFIHGLGSSHAFYSTVIPGLVEKGYACLSVDTPGSGLSVPISGDNSTRALSNIFEEVMKALSLHREATIVVGHSMGAIVASELSRSQLGTVLIGPVHPTPALGDIFNKRIEAVNKNGLEFLADTIPNAATGSKATPTQRAFIRALILSQTPDNYNSLCRTIATAKAPEYGGPSSTSPLLIIAGSDDKTSPLEGCKTITDSWQGAGDKKLEVLDGVGHWQCIEAPAQVLDLLDAFAKPLIGHV